jgi:hypothetical protein
MVYVSYLIAESRRKRTAQVVEHFDDAYRSCISRQMGGEWEMASEWKRRYYCDDMGLGPVSCFTLSLSLWGVMMD